MRLIEAVFPAAAEDDVRRILELAEPVHWRIEAADADGDLSARALVTPEHAQETLDALQSHFADQSDWRLTVLPVEATLPKVEEPEPEPEPEAERAARAQQATMALREEIYTKVSEGAKFGVDLLALTALSTVVAAIGMSADNVTIVIAAMVIAPLLGPLLAFSFGGALGDLDLMVSAAKTAAAGLSTGITTAFLYGLLAPVNLSSAELLTRADVGLDSIAIALASGAAAALSITSGLSATMVGVMLAAALLPPAAALGLFAGAGELGLAFRAGVLLALNIVCVNLAAQVVYAWKGVRPRTWLERVSAKRAGRVTMATWGGLLALLVGLVLLLRR